MRFAVDATTLCDRHGGRGAGIEHYTWSLLFALLRLGREHEWWVSVPAACPPSRLDELAGGMGNVHFLKMKNRLPFLSRHVLLPMRLRLHRAQALWSPWGQTPLLWGCPSVITVHDLCIFEHPQWFPAPLVHDLSMELLVPRSVQKAATVIVPSRFTQQQLARVFPKSAAKTCVIPEGVEPPDRIYPELLNRFELTEDTILYLGTVEPRKNLIPALQAFDLFLENKPDRVRQTRFVIAGKMGWKSADVQAAIARLNRKWNTQVAPGVVRQVGEVSEKEKWALLQGASVLVFPSLEEGFGLPVLEAMAVGTPVICSPRGALPEVGGDAVMYVEPDDVEAMALALTQCLLVPEGARLLREEGLKRAAQFTWQRAAQATLDVLLTAAAGAAK